MQVHQYGQSIVGEVLAPNKETAQRLFLSHYKYTSVKNGKFFVGELWYPGKAKVDPKSYLGYVLEMQPRQIRSVRAVVHAKSPSPFPPHPLKPEGRTQYTRPPINTQKRTGGLYNPDAHKTPDPVPPNIEPPRRPPPPPPPPKPRPPGWRLRPNQRVSQTPALPPCPSPIAQTPAAIPLTQNVTPARPVARPSPPVAIVSRRPQLPPRRS